MCAAGIPWSGVSAPWIPHGPVRLKTASGWGVVRSKPEYEDVARIARGQGISLAEVFDWLK